MKAHVEGDPTLTAFMAVAQQQAVIAKRVLDAARRWAETRTEADLSALEDATKQLRALQQAGEALQQAVEQRAGPGHG